MFLDVKINFLKIKKTIILIYFQIKIILKNKITTISKYRQGNRVNVVRGWWLMLKWRAGPMEVEIWCSIYFVFVEIVKTVSNSHV